MAELNLTRALKAAGIAWTLGVASFVAAFLLPTSNPDLVANTVLFCAVPLVATVGARFYYQHAAAKGVVQIRVDKTGCAYFRSTGTRHKDLPRPRRHKLVSDASTQCGELCAV